MKQKAELFKCTGEQSKSGKNWREANTWKNEIALGEFPLCSQLLVGSKAPVGARSEWWCKYPQSYWLAEPEDSFTAAGEWGGNPEKETAKEEEFKFYIYNMPKSPVLTPELKTCVADSRQPS